MLARKTDGHGIPARAIDAPRVNVPVVAGWVPLVRIRSEAEVIAAAKAWRRSRERLQHAAVFALSVCAGAALALGWLS
jgi:hypothetical protein